MFHKSQKFGKINNARHISLCVSQKNLVIKSESHTLTHSNICEVLVIKSNTLREQFIIVNFFVRGTIHNSYIKYL